MRCNDALMEERVVRGYDESIAKSTHPGAGAVGDAATDHGLRGTGDGGRTTDY
jgi:hypothetical protein